MTIGFICTKFLIWNKSKFNEEYCSITFLSLLTIFLLIQFFLSKENCISLWNQRSIYMVSALIYGKKSIIIIRIELSRYFICRKLFISNWYFFFLTNIKVLSLIWNIYIEECLSYRDNKTNTAAILIIYSLKCNFFQITA